MVKLLCVIVGSPRSSSFPVDIDAGQSVDELKKAIKEKPNILKGVDTGDLQLFLAKMADGKWLDGAGAAAVTLNGGGRPQGFEQMDPMLCINGDKHFGKNFGPAEGEVHVLVVVPEGEGSQTGGTALRSIKELGDLIEASVNKVLDDRDKKRSIYSLSDLHTEHREKMAKKMRLNDDYIAVDEPTPLQNARILPYTWLDVPEDANNQRTKYMTYLETHFKIVLEEERLSWLDVTKNKTVLSIVDPRLPFSMRGTANVLLVDRRSIQHHEPLAGVRMVVELKKKVEQHHKPEAFGELVSASLKAPLNCTLIGLLTDLNDQWHFSWFNEKKVLTHVRIVHPKNAFDFIAAAIAEPASSKPFSVPFMSRPLTKFKIDDFLPMSDDGADEMMERYELMADVVEPEFLMARREEYARQLVQSMPMYAHMYT